MTESVPVFCKEGDMSSPVDMMERNFVSYDYEESRYIKALHTSAQARKNISINRQNSILQAGMAACEALEDKYQGRYAERILEGKKAARNMMYEGQTATAEASKRNLDEIKDHIEEKAKEALEALGEEKEAATTTEEETSGQKTQDSQQASSSSQATDNAATPPASQDTEGSGTTATPAAPPAAAAPVAVLPTPTGTPSTGMKIDIVV